MVVRSAVFLAGLAGVAAPLASCGRPGGSSGSPAAVYPAVVAPCSATRIGAVAVTGAPPETVAALAVLEGTHDDPARTARVAAAAREALRWSGYADARIDVHRAAGCFVDLRVAVVLGPRYHISTIAFETDDGFPADARFAAIEDALGTVNTVGGVHIDYRLRRALDGLARRYRDAGWLDAEIEEPIAHYAAAGSAHAARGEVALHIKIHAGRRYRVGAIRARGATEHARRQLLDELGVDPGAWYDGPRVRAGLERARRRLARPIELEVARRGRHVALEARVAR